MNSLGGTAVRRPDDLWSRGYNQCLRGTFHCYVWGIGPVWTNAKQRLASFTTVHQDGDDEGILILSRVPDADEAATLRYYIGLRQTLFPRGDPEATRPQAA